VNLYNNEEEMKAALDRKFVVGGHKAFWIARLGRKYRVYLVSKLNPHFVRRCHFEPVELERHQAVVDALIREAGAAARIAVIPHAGFTLPSLRAPVEAMTI
jgi:nickel-dependent lactate racemase